MIRAHVVNSRNISLYEQEWDVFLRERHQVFVEEKKWRPPSPDGRELDQFDTSDATYILGIEDGQVVSSARIIPSDKPTLVSEYFSHMCELEGGPPHSADCAEWTRTFVVPERRSHRPRGALTEICCAVMEYALEQGFKTIGGIQETYFVPYLRRLGWAVRPLGMARKVGNEWCIVAYIDVTDDALASVRRKLGISSSLLTSRSPVA